jgi:hypothetical protein
MEDALFMNGKKRVVLSVLWFAVLCGCGNGGVGTDGDVVGGPCTESGCAGGSTCLTASMYPDGMCSIECSSQADCPDGTACITEGGGRCVLTCNDASDCRDGYGCNEKSTPGDGQASVCIR